MMVDDVGADVFTRLRDGSRVRVHEGAVMLEEQTLVTGRELGSDEIEKLMEEARSGLTTQLQSFTHNTTEFLRREQDLLLHGAGRPDHTDRPGGAPGCRGGARLRLPRGPAPAASGSSASSVRCSSASTPVPTR